MRYLLLIFIFATGVASGQEAIYPEVFQNVKGVKTIKSFSGDTLKHMYILGVDGKVTSRRDYNKDKVEGKEVYTYENGKIVSLRSYQEREYVYENEGTATSYSPADFKWDSTRITFEIKYTQGPNGITSYKYFANPGHELLVDIDYTYGPDNRLKKEVIKTYPRSGSQKYTSHAKEPASRHREYAYEPNLTTIYYYADGKLTGTENIVTTSDGRVTNRVSKDNTGRIIGYVTYNYNTQGLLLEKLVNDKGEGAFGKGHVILFDKEIYAYDEKGRMVTQVAHLRGKLVHELAYRYE
jgi:hypothetical protein